MLEVERLLRRYKARMETLCANAPPGLTEELVPSLAQSTVTVSEIASLDALLPAPFPPSFRAYLLGPVVESGPESSEINLPSNNGLHQAREFLLRRRFWPLKLLAFAGGPCGDPVCFDTSHVSALQEYPVLVINHDWASPEDWLDPQRVRGLASASWPSFLHLFRAICEGTPVAYKTTPPGA